jgi:nucleotide-binding universal stress UspA family protein
MNDPRILPADSIRRVLVPLDGSSLAEAALPFALAVSARFGAAVTLLHVLEREPPAAVHGEPHLTNREEAQRYLTALASVSGAATGPIQTHVHEVPERSVSESIAAHAAEMQIDLIVMANHGSGGLRGLLFGRVAQQVLQLSALPVLVVPAKEAPPVQPVKIERLALLQNRTTESAVPLALTMAAAFDAEIRLILVVPTVGSLDGEDQAPATLLPSAARELLEIEERESAQYLEVVRKRIGPEHRVSIGVVRGDPAGSAIEEAERIGADLIVLATHARGGLGALLSGSVGSKVFARSAIPLLLIPATG